MLRKVLTRTAKQLSGSHVEINAQVHNYVVNMNWMFIDKLPRYEVCKNISFEFVKMSHTITKVELKLCATVSTHKKRRHHFLADR